MWTTQEIRRSFIRFFKQKQHESIKSASLVPAGDKTLLFTNAGMVPFKDVFLGLEKRSFAKAVSVQKCIRAGGKHNDLDNVGYTARHHTFFEMLGNFSFGAYFKREAIKYAWEYLTEVLQLPKEKLWVTVFEEDREAEAIWLDEVRISPERFSRIGAKDNFWAMGQTGPCGPCTEIFYDHGEKVPGGPPGSLEAEKDRYIEIWNIVFMQYNRLADGTLVPLSNPSVDTGMGLERLAAVLQKVHSNYEIDLFQALIQAIAGVLDVSVDERQYPSLCVIADHIRSCTFLIADGVLPANEGRGYVLRRIIRRAVRHGHKLGAKTVFFYRIVSPLVKEMGEAYPELKAKQALIESVLKEEETQFCKTLSHGLKLFEQSISRLEINEIPGEVAFNLYDTYGFPLDLTCDMAKERGLSVDISGFDEAMARQKSRAKAAGTFALDYTRLIKTDTESAFLGHVQTAAPGVIEGIYQEAKKTVKLGEGQKGVMVLDQTPFYAESGGQVGDHGVIETATAVFKVKDTQKAGHTVLHIGEVVKGTFSLHESVQATVDENKRLSTALNHTATHLLHAALRRIIGEHVEQKGSLVDCSRLRFDFANPSPLDEAQLREVERQVNGVIRQNLKIETIETDIDAAIKMGAMALFGEKYADRVRVVKINNFSKELCGGTHAERTGELGFFKIISESGIAAGVRRIEAMTGACAEGYIEAQQEILSTVCESLKAKEDDVLDRLVKLQSLVKDQEKTIRTLQSELVSKADTPISEALIGKVTLVSALLPNVDMPVLRDKIDQYKSQKPNVVVALASVAKGKAQIAVGVSQSLVDRIKAGELANYIAGQVGGKGGGRPDMAQAGGSDPEKLPSAMASVGAWLRRKISDVEVS